MKAHLLPISPQGAHSENIESLPSLLLRLSWHHAISPAVLADYLRARGNASAASDLEIPVSRSRGYDFARLLLTNGRTGEVLEGLRKTYGHEDFRACTMYALKGFDAHLAGQFRHTLGWCPHCLREDADSGRTPYFRLLWSLRGYAACHIHECAIEGRCASCSAKQSSWSYRELSACWKCGSFLGNPVTPAGSIALDGRGLTERLQLIELIREMASDPGIKFDPEGCRAVIDNFVSQVKSCFPRRTTLKQIFGTATPIVLASTRNVSLANCLHFASAFGFSLVELLKADVVLAQDELSVMWKINQLYDFEPAQRPERRPFEKVRDMILRQHRCFASPPYPLEYYVGLTGVSRGCLESRYPSLCREIVEKHKEHLQEIKRESRLRIYRGLYSYISEHGQLPGKKKMLGWLQSRLGVPKNFTRSVLAEERATRLFQLALSAKVLDTATFSIDRGSHANSIANTERPGHLSLGSKER